MEEFEELVLNLDNDADDIEIITKTVLSFLHKQRTTGYYALFIPSRYTNDWNIAGFAHSTLEAKDTIDELMFKVEEVGMRICSFVASSQTIVSGTNEEVCKQTDEKFAFLEGYGMIFVPQQSDDPLCVIAMIVDETVKFFHPSVGQFLTECANIIGKRLERLREKLARKDDGGDFEVGV